MWQQGEQDIGLYEKTFIFGSLRRSFTCLQVIYSVLAGICVSRMESFTRLFNSRNLINPKQGRYIYILKIILDTRASQLKNEADLQLLSTRRKISKLTFLHNHYYNNPLLRLELVKPPHRIFPRLDHQHKILLQEVQKSGRVGSFRLLQEPRTKLFQISPLQLAIND